MSVDMGNYYKDYKALYNFNTLRDTIYNQTKDFDIKTLKINTEKDDKKATKKAHKVRPKIEPQSIVLIHQPNDMITINNDNYFSIIFNNFRKQKAPISYIYYDNTLNSLVIFIKNPIGFPLIIANIPNDITKQNVYINPTYIDNDKCYTLPLTDSIFKTTNISTKSLEYYIKYVLDNGNIKFMFNYKVPTSQPIIYETTKINNVPIRTVFNTLFTDKVDQLGILINTNEFDAMIRLNTMTLSIISRQISSDSFNTSDTSKCNNKLVIDIEEGSLNYIQETSSVNKVYKLCDKDNSIRWNINFNNIKSENNTYNFDLYNFTSMFKNNYTKVMLNNNKIIYYIFGQFYEDVYILGKITVDKEIDKNTIQRYNIADIFSTGFVTKEIYICKNCNMYKK